MFWIEKFFNEITDIAVPTFFVLSGYLFFQNYTPKVLLRKWKSRFFSVLIPYLIWNAVGYLYIFILSMIPYIKDRLTNSIDGFNFIEFFKAIIIGEYNGVTWFLQCLIVYILLTPLLYWIIKNKYGVAIVLVILLVLLTIINKQIVNYWIMYMLGACLGLHGKSFMRMKFTQTPIFIACIYLILSVMIGMIFDIQTTHHQITVYTIVRLSQVVAIWILAGVLAMEKSPKWWMTISFFIYCCHSMILESVEKVFLIVFGKNLFGAAIDFVFAPFITLSLIVLLAFILHKIKPMWKVLTGSRGM